MGMSGGLLLRQILPREQIEAEGIRLGYRDAALDDFVEIMTRINAIDFAEDVKRQTGDLAAAHKKAHAKTKKR